MYNGIWGKKEEKKPGITTRKGKPAIIENDDEDDLQYIFA